MLTFQTERLANVRAEAEPLLLRHWEEVALNKDVVRLDPDWDAYAKVEALGMLCVTTARHDGKLIGYVSDVLSPNLHYRSLKTAANDLFWLAPEHRKGGLGLRLLLASEGFAREMGANQFVKRVKLHLDFGPVLERLGYVPIERVYSKLVF